jgi:hypothetical protein
MLSSPAHTLTYRHLSAAAQNIAAAEFALQGFDVLDQTGHAAHPHNLSVATSSGMMKMVVHGSLDGLWDLVDSYLVEGAKSQKEEYHRAINRWLDRYRQTTCCLVQFDSTNLIGMPRIYLASAAEVAQRLHESVDLRGEMALRAGGPQSGSLSLQDSLPARWRFSEERIRELMSAPKGETPVRFRISEADRCHDCAEAQPAKCAKCLPMMN